MSQWKESPRLRRTVLGVLLWAVAAVLFLLNLGYPRAVVFDETYLIPRAQRYQQGIFFQESHPPLGRLVVALGQTLVHPQDRPRDFALVEKIRDSWPEDQDMTGYRLLPALIGSLIPLIVYFILINVIGNEVYAFLLSLFLAFDNALLTQSRFALSDSTLIAFCFLSILAFVVAYSRPPEAGRRQWVGWAIWGFVSAAATLVKFSAWFILLLVPLYLARLYLDGHRKSMVSFLAVFASAFLLTWVLVWQLHFSLVPKLDPSNTYEISQEHRDILEGKSHPDPFTKFYIQLRDGLLFISHYHAGVPNLDLTKPGEIGSAWYQWPLGGRAISYRWETPDSNVYRYVYLIGNPAVWLLSLFGVLSGTGLAISDRLFRFLTPEQRRWPYIFTGLYWAYMIPPMFVDRVLYLYHYLPPLILGLLLLAVVFNAATGLAGRTKLRILGLAFALVLAGFWVYKPFTYYEPLTDAQLKQRAVWSVWDLRCAKCEGDGG